MSDFKFSNISDLAWNQNKIIENVHKNKSISQYIIECHIIILISTMVYGAVLGFYVKDAYIQILLNALKLPIMFLVTLYITIPIIFIVDALLENKINFSQVTTILLLGFTSSAIVLIAFTPLMFFFILTALDYNFIVILNIVICGFAGYFGIISILTSFKRFHNDKTWSPALVIGSFMIVFVGTQLAWTLRPFFHTSDQFTRPVSGNFYVALANLIAQNPVVSAILISIFVMIALIITLTRLATKDTPVRASEWVPPSQKPRKIARQSTTTNGMDNQYPSQPYHPSYYYPNYWGAPTPAAAPTPTPSASPAATTTKPK